MAETRLWQCPAIFLVSLAVYTMTRHHGVPGGDSGELMAMVCAWGVPHPPGYPLLTLLGQAWLEMCPHSLGSPASRLSILPCLLGSASAGLFFHAARLVCSHSSDSRKSGGGDAWASLLATGFYAFSTLTWTYSTQFEVFALNNLFCSSLLFLSILFLQDQPEWIPYCGAWLCGLSLTNQHTIVLLLIPLVLSVIVKSRGSILKPIPLIPIVFLFALGLLPYLYLPLSAKDPPLGSWGGQDSWEGFRRHVLREEYGTFQLYTTGSPAADSNASFDALRNLQRQTWLYLRSYAAEALGTAPVLSLLGLAMLMKERSGKAMVLGSCFVVYVLVFHSLANLPEDDFFRPILSRFWMQLNQISFLAFAYGAHVVFRLLDTSASAEFVKPVVCTSLIAVQIAYGWNECNHADNRVIDQFARDQLASIPRNAIALCSGDLNYYPLLYLQLCEGLRRDVLPVNTAMIKGDWFAEKQATNYPSVSFPGQIYAPATERCNDEVYNMRCFLEANLKSSKARKSKKGRRVALLRKWPPDDASHEGLYEDWPHGLVREAIAVSEGPAGRSFLKWLNGSVAALPSLDVYHAAKHLLQPDGEERGQTVGSNQQPNWGGGGEVVPRGEPEIGGEGSKSAVVGRKGLDNWERAAVEEYVAAHTAASKFLIAALRDDASARGIPANHSGVAGLAVAVSEGVAQALPDESVPVKNLGALHQHLMNVVTGHDFVPGGGHVGHMGHMVWAYERFVAVATERGEDDPDVEVLREWTAQVRRWMSDSGHAHRIPTDGLG